MPAVALAEPDGYAGLKVSVTAPDRPLSLAGVTVTDVAPTASRRGVVANSKPLLAMDTLVADSSPDLTTGMPAIWSRPLPMMATDVPPMTGHGRGTFR